jgi:hypothetical protein
MMTDSQKNRLPSVQSSEALSDQTADDEDIIILQDEVAPTEETESDFQQMSPPDDDADEEFVTLTDEVPVDAQTDDDEGGNLDEDIISLMDELSADDEPDNETAHSEDEDLVTLTDEIAFDEGLDHGQEEGQDEDVISLTDQLSFDAQTDEGPAESRDNDVINSMDEIPVEDESEDGLAESQEEDIISLIDELSPDDEPDNGSGQSPHEDLFTPTDENFVDAEADEGLGESQDEDLISLMDQLSLDAQTDNAPGESRDRNVNGPEDQPSGDEEPYNRPVENQEDDVVRLREDPGAQPADRVLALTGEPTAGEDEISDITSAMKEFAEPESKPKASHNVTDTIDMSAKKEAASLPREEILPLTDEPEQEVILLNEDIDLKVGEITDDRAAEDSEARKPEAAANIFDFGLNAALTDENKAQADDGDSEVELAEITPLDADDALNSDSVLDEQILEVVEFDEDLSEVENPALERPGRKAQSATDDDMLFGDDSAEDVLNVEDLEADSDDSEIDDLIHDFFEDATPAADSRSAVSEAQPNQLESEIQFPDDFFDDDEFKFTFETKDISDKIDQLADETSAERPAADAPPIFPLSDDSGKPVKSPEEADFLAISEAQLDAAVQRVIERNFLGKIEILIGQTIEKAVSQEIVKLKRLLLDKISGEDAE